MNKDNEDTNHMTLSPSEYQTFVKAWSTELSEEQINALKSLIKDYGVIDYGQDID